MKTTKRLNQTEVNQMISRTHTETKHKRAKTKENT